MVGVVWPAPTEFKLNDRIIPVNEKTALPQVPVNPGKVFGSMMNYSDGIYGGHFIGAIYSEAFFVTDMRKAIEKGLESIPAEIR